MKKFEDNKESADSAARNEGKVVESNLKKTATSINTVDIIKDKMDIKQPADQMELETYLNRNKNKSSSSGCRHT